MGGITSSRRDLGLSGIPFIMPDWLLAYNRNSEASLAVNRWNKIIKTTSQIILNDIRINIKSKSAQIINRGLNNINKNDSKQVNQNL